MIKDIRELNFPSYATLESATVALADMGEWNIASQIRIDGQIAPDFSFDWEVMHDGHKYIMPLREPQASVENTSLDSTIDLTFQHWAQYQLKRWYFFTVQPVESGTAVPDKYIASVSLTLPNFINLFNQVLAYYYGNKIKIQLNPAWVSKDEPTTVEISHSYIWDVLLKLYELYAVRWTIEADPNNEGCYIIKVGYGAKEISHVFEYGFEGGLLKVERQVQNENIRNILIGRGGEKNLPYRYYKDVDKNNDSFPADPDWIPELANIHFDVLRGATFRSYIQGWKAKHYHGTATKDRAYAPWAWEKGYTDAKFNPIEYVKDDESIAKYGPLEGGFDDNEDFYPTIQGVNSADHLNFFGTDFGRVDQGVAVTKITKEESEIVKPNDSKEETLAKLSQTVTLAANERKTITIQGTSFTVPTGKNGDLYVSIKAFTNTDKVIPENTTVEVYKGGTSTAISASGIPEGSYTYKVNVELHNTATSSVTASIGDNSPILITATPDEELNGTFDIWIKNIWGTTKKSTETDKEYAERVWLPILGGSDGSEAKIVFSSGWLSTNEDYEFMIVKGGINYDTTKTLTKNGKTSQSHWRLTLARCDAEYEATGKYIPNKELNANDGDYFFFTGIDMPNAYTVWAEERLDNWKKDQLLKVANIQPTRVVQTDRVRMNNYGNPGALIDQIKPGCSVTLRDDKFIPGSHEEALYIQSVTITYRKPSSTDNALNPDVEMTLGKEYAVSGNVVEQLQGDIEVLQRQIGSISNVAEIVESIANKKFLRKDRSDKTPYSLGIGGSLDVNDRIDLGQFLAGVSGARLGVDREDGKTFLEVDNIYARVRAYFEQLTIIDADTVAGRRYITPGGSVKCSMVEETDTGYRCYFLSEQDGEKTETYIKAGDQAIAEMFNAKTGTANSVSNHRWWRLVTDVQQSAYIDDAGNVYGYIEVSKSDCEAKSDIPQEGDVICQLGSRNDTTRQAAMVFDTVGSNAPSVTLLTGIDSYSLAGKDIISYGYDKTKGNAFFNVYGDTYIGDRDGSTFIKYDRATNQLDIKARISASSTIGNQSIADYIDSRIPEVPTLTEQDILNLIGGKLDNLQDQIDGAIETWYYDGEPTLTNEPAKNWQTEEDREIHSGDLYYDKTSGLAYRFQKDGNQWVWVLIKDTDIAKALAEAEKAQATADGKMKVFGIQPTNADAYDEGDIWVNATYSDATHNFSNDILRCKTAKAAGAAFSIDHWMLASKYTDDTLAQSAWDESQKAIYLTQVLPALKDQTIINGGLGLSTVFMFGQNIGTEQQKIWSGISGVYDTALKGRSIGSWWGGDAIDLFNPDGTLKNPTPANAAASLVRMDGSAYWGKGLFGFESDGHGWFGAGDNKIEFKDGVMTFGSGITINVKDENGIQQTLQTVLNQVLSFGNALTPMYKDADGRYQPTTWGEISKGNKTLAAIKTDVGFYSEKFISALGANDAPVPAGVTKLSALNDVALTGLTPGQILEWNGTKWVNTDKPTGGGLDISELADYLTTHDYLQSSALSGYATQQWVSQQIAANAYTHPTYDEFGVDREDNEFLCGITTNRLGHVIAVDSRSITSADIPNLATSKITGLDASLTSLGDRIKTFEDLFGIDADGNVFIKTGKGFYTEGFISAKGKSDTANGGASYNRLDAWSNYSSDKAGYVLSAGLGYGLYTRLATAENNINSLDYGLSAVNTDLSALDNRVSTLEGKNYLSSLTVTDKNPTLSWGAKSAVAEINGTAINVTMPANPATDTLNTAGATNLTGQKMFLVGATAQGANPQTYSNANVYIGTDNCLYSGGSKVLTAVSWGDVSGKPAWIGSSKPSYDWSEIANKPTSFMPSTHTHYYITASYSGSGGKQGPGYFGRNSLGSIMSCAVVNGNGSYKNWIYVDAYGGNDVGGTTAIGVNRQALGAYIMRAAAGATDWAESAELLGTHNWSSYCAAKEHTHSQYLTAHQSLANYRTLTNNAFSTVVEIDGTTSDFASNPNILFHIPNVYWGRLKMDSAGTLHYLQGGVTAYNSYLPIKASSFVRNGGTSSQFLKADGSVDSNAYITSSGSCAYATSAGNADTVDGVHNGALTAKCFGITYPSTVNVTVANGKANLLNAIKGNCFGNIAAAGQSLITNWNNDNATTVASSTYSVINVTPQYDGDTYGQYLLFHYASYEPKLIGRTGGQWTAMRTFAFLDSTVANSRTVLDRSNSTATYLNYGAAGISYPSWYAAWNGYELRAISPANVLAGIGALSTSGGSLSGHLYLTGANTSSSTSNTSQIVFTSGGDQQVAISSNKNALVINPTTSGTDGQVVLGVNGVRSYFAGNIGINQNSPLYPLDINRSGNGDVMRITSANITWASIIYQAQNGNLFSVGSNQSNFFFYSAATSGYVFQVDGGGGIQLNTKGHIKFNSVSREINFNNSRFCFGSLNQGTAEGVNVGSLLVSNAWADYTKVPTNGIYSKGTIKSEAGMALHSATATGNWSYIRLQSGAPLWDIALNDNISSAMDNKSLEFRKAGTTLGMFLRYAGSAYGKLGIVSETAESSIGYYINHGTNASSGFPTWTAGVGIGSATGFGWWYSTVGWKAYLDADGNYFTQGDVRIGTSAQIMANAIGAYTDANGDSTLTFRTVGAGKMTLNKDGNLYVVGGINAKKQLYTDGTCHAVVGIWSDGYVSAKGQNTSDIRLKTDIRDFTASDIIRSLRPRAFRWNALAKANSQVFDTETTQYGLIAQETQAVAPWLVKPDMFGDGYFGVWYDKLIPILLQGQKETMSEVDRLKARVAKLENALREHGMEVCDA